MRAVTPDIRRLLIWPAILCLSFSLQGCLLDYFFAPKIAAGELPSDPAIESLRSAYITQCGRCHLLIAPTYFNRERPIDLFTDRYLAGKIINRQEADDVATYIRTLSTLTPASPAPSPAPLATPPMPEADNESDSTPAPEENQIIPLPDPSPAASANSQPKPGSSAKNPGKSTNSSKATATPGPSGSPRP